MADRWEGIKRYTWANEREWQWLWTTKASRCRRTEAEGDQKGITTVGIQTRKQVTLIKSCRYYSILLLGPSVQSLYKNLQRTNMYIRTHTYIYIYRNLCVCASYLSHEDITADFLWFCYEWSNFIEHPFSLAFGFADVLTEKFDTASENLHSRSGTVWLRVHQTTSKWRSALNCWLKITVRRIKEDYSRWNREKDVTVSHFVMHDHCVICILEVRRQKSYVDGFYCVARTLDSNPVLLFSSFMFFSFNLGQKESEYHEVQVFRLLFFIILWHLSYKEGTAKFYRTTDAHKSWRAPNKPTWKKGRVKDRAIRNSWTSSG